MVTIFFFNPFQVAAANIERSAQLTLFPRIIVYERGNDRLFVLEPERVVIYNTAGALYYYFEGGVSNRVCPLNEHAVVRIASTDINLINETGTYNITCTAINSLSLINHFANTALQHVVPIYDTQFTVLQVINFLIFHGYALIN
ncbi:odv-e28 [Hyphantria cunea granulovirus]|uniref:Odv-e28 n=1 Tax=Hyphantria cunea granulovirus TaxID=307448 RepID=A0AAF1D291_9BBAC|nr:odv-e28 [Hyphantria cunea granulovirus]QBQ01631.1 odv-e28 [Hyphantria cunea granulovirus]